MIGNLTNSLFYTFTFYIVYSMLHRFIEIKKYIKKTKLDGTYDEEYKIKYSKHLKGECISLSLMMGIITLSANYTNTIYSLVIGATVGLPISGILKKYYPKP